MENQKLILYGEGKFGRKILDDTRALRLDVVAFWDSNFSLYGTQKEGVPILIQASCPKNQRYDDVIILLTTIKENDVIADRIQSLGYENEKDFFKAKTWLGWAAKIWMGGT